MAMLTNTRHEKFAQNVANGMSASAAYKAAGYNSTNLDVHSARLMVNDGIKSRIAELQGETAKTQAITREEVVQFLADAVKTPAGHVHKNHPLCQSFKDTADCTEIRTTDKLGAISQLLKMIPGWAEPEKVESKLEIVIRKL
jgi:hypothetical protein